MATLRDSVFVLAICSGCAADVEREQIIEASAYEEARTPVQELYPEYTNELYYTHSGDISDACKQIILSALEKSVPAWEYYDRFDTPEYSDPNMRVALTLTKTVLDQIRSYPDDTAQPFMPVFETMPEEMRFDIGNFGEKILFDLELVDFYGREFHELSTTINTILLCSDAQGLVWIPDYWVKTVNHKDNYVVVVNLGTAHVSVSATSPQDLHTPSRSLLRRLMSVFEQSTCPAAVVQGAIDNIAVPAQSMAVLRVHPQTPQNQDTALEIVATPTGAQTPLYGFNLPIKVYGPPPGAN